MMIGSINDSKEEYFMRREVLKKFGSICLVCALVFSVIPYEVVSAKNNFVIKSSTKLKLQGNNGIVNSEKEISLKGEGTESNPYLISNASELKSVLDAIDKMMNRGKYNSAYYKMTSDISMDNIKIHENMTCKKEFTGCFDGDGHVISGLDTTALFQNVKYATIKNLSIKNSRFSITAIADIEDNDNFHYPNTRIINCSLEKDVTINNTVSNSSCYIGSIASYANCENCVSKAVCNVILNTEGNKRIYIGGLVGKSYGVKKCTFDGKLKVSGKNGNISVGGISGSDDDCISCDNKGSIDLNCTSLESVINYAGGIVGDGYVIMCYNSGNIKSTDTNMDIGGIVGKGSVVLCSNKGEVSGERSVGGLVAATGNVYSSYNCGNVTGKKYIGGIAAETNFGKIYNSYTCGKVFKKSNNVEMGIAIGKNIGTIYKKSFYQKQDSLIGIGDGQNVQGLDEKTEQELKSAEILEKLNDISDSEIKDKYLHHWKIDNSNNGYPLLVIEMVFFNDESMRDISIESDKKIYYAYLPLKAKAYTLKSKDIKEADYYDGEYHIDYSEIKTSKSTAIGIAIEKKDYNVQGFKYEQGIRYVFVSSFEPNNEENKSKVKMKKEKTEKKYQCLGSDFLSVVQIAEIPSKYTSKISGTKFIYNWEDGNRCGKYLLDMVKRTYYGTKESSTKSGYKSRAARLTQKLSPSEDDCLSFLWRKKGDKKWIMDSELTFNKLKEYGVIGTTLQIRYLDNCLLYAYKKVSSDGDDFYEDDESNDIDEEFYGNIINVKIPKLKKKAAPKIKIDIDNMKINIKNGMQVSFNQKEWYTIFPYSKNGGYTASLFDDEFNSYDLNDRPYTSHKVNSISLLDDTLKKYWGKDIYVRLLGKNNLPSEAAIVRLPSEMSNAPRLDIVNNNGKFIIQNITKGDNDTVSNAQYEYCIGEDSKFIYNKIDDDSGYSSISVSHKWKKIEIGVELNNKLSTKYTYKVYKYHESDDGPTKVTSKSYGKTVYLFGKKGDENPILDIYVRRKADKSSGTLASYYTCYKYNTEKNVFEHISDENKNN